MLDYYSKNYIEYHNRTFNIDPSFFLEPFANRLTQQGTIIDIGCASGRDMLWLKNKGFNVIGFEKSNGLMELAQKNTGCKIIKGDYEFYDFSKLSADAVLASGSLVHLAHKKLPDVLKNIIKAVKSSEIHDSDNKMPLAQLYISLKQGNGKYTDNKARTFYLWQDSELRDIFNHLGFSVIDFIKNESAMGTGEIWLGYVCSKKIK